MQPGEQDNSSQQPSTEPSLQTLPNKLGVELPKSMHAHSSISNESRKDANNSLSTDTDNKEVKITTHQAQKDNSINNFAPITALAEKPSSNNNADNEEIASVKSTKDLIEHLNDGVSFSQTEKLSLIECNTTLGTATKNIAKFA